LQGGFFLMLASLSPHSVQSGDSLKINDIAIVSRDQISEDHGKLCSHKAGCHVLARTGDGIADNRST
jgi:hypothetical protein